MTPDAATIHGIRFHVAGPRASMPPRKVLLAWRPSTVDGVCSYMMSLDEPWPEHVKATVTAIVVKDHKDLAEAMAMVEAKFGAGTN